MNTNAASEMLQIVQEGPFTDIFLALQARHLVQAIGEHADGINTSSFKPLFAAVQSHAADCFILAVTRLLEREGSRYPLQSVQGALLYLRAHATQLPLREPVFLEQSMDRLGYWPQLEALHGAQLTEAVVDALLGRLPHLAENNALNALKTLRDKRIAHPERVRVESLPATTWEDADTLLKIPIEALAVLGGYFSTAYVDNQGRLLTDTDSQVAANAMRRLVRGIGAN
jgi:hypothetical protein